MVAGIIVRVQHRNAVSGGMPHTYVSGEIMWRRRGERMILGLFAGLAAI